MTLRWSPRAEIQATRSLQYIMERSPQSGIGVLKDIQEFLEKVVKHPFRCPPDKDKIGNNGPYRAFEIHHFRVSYRVLANEIVVQTFRHTSRKPTSY